jgi:murein DD-endopeptidase MepM/ murein hydrolase activator NlpD
VTYRVYIMKDYKTGAVTPQVRSHRSLFILLSSLGLILISTLLILSIPEKKPVNIMLGDKPEINIPAVQQESIDEYAVEPEYFETTGLIEEITINAPELNDVIEIPPPATKPESKELIVEALEESLPESIEQQSSEVVQRVTVKTGDSLALIFSRLGLSPRSLYNIMSLGKEVSRLKKLRPGQKLNFYIDGNELIKLEYEVSLTNSLLITKQDDKFQAELISEELEPLVIHAKATIKDSLFLSGKRAGLSDNLIMQLVAIYGWDIDFALDIREGDSFTLIYEEQYKDGIKVADGPIIAAEFINRNTPLRAVRYKHDDGRVDYYADNGDAMRKAFLRTPVQLARISSRFNLKRKHPILNKIRAHKGVDYAASTGTPIKATGDGTVALAGKKGGYGRTVILKHGGKYSTLYAHLHKYARGVRTGKRVKQGQIIGYVGKSGLATGPHLHYEFRINGVHRNPLTVKLPKVESINKKALPEFLQTINPMIAELDRLTGKRALASQQTENPPQQLSALMEDG